MRLPHLLVGLIVVATAAFVVGVTVERNSEEGHDEAAEVKSAESGESEAEEGAEGEAAGGEEGEESGEAESGESLFGVNLESTPLVILAALGSLALAAGVWVRPRFGLLLGLVGVAMVVFAALDVREVTLKLDEDRGELALLAAVVAALHLAAAAVAAVGARAAPDHAVRTEP